MQLGSGLRCSVMSFQNGALMLNSWSGVFHGWQAIVTKLVKNTILAKCTILDKTAWPYLSDDPLATTVGYFIAMF